MYTNIDEFGIFFLIIIFFSAHTIFYHFYLHQKLTHKHHQQTNPHRPTHPLTPTLSLISTTRRISNNINTIPLRIKILSQIIHQILILVASSLTAAAEFFTDRVSQSSVFLARVGGAGSGGDAGARGWSLVEAVRGLD